MLFVILMACWGNMNSVSDHFPFSGSIHSVVLSFIVLKLFCKFVAVWLYYVYYAPVYKLAQLEKMSHFENVLFNVWKWKTP